MDVREVLVSVKCGDRSAGVVRGDDGQVWLSWSVDQIGGSRVDDWRAAHLGLEDERTLLGVCFRRARFRLRPWMIAAGVSRPLSATASGSVVQM